MINEKNFNNNIFKIEQIKNSYYQTFKITIKHDTFIDEEYLQAEIKQLLDKSQFKLTDIQHISTFNCGLAKVTINPTEFLRGIHDKIL